MMGIKKMNNEVSIANGSARLNHHTQVKNKETRDGLRGEVQGLSEEHFESRINVDVQDVNNGQMEAIQVQDRDQTCPAQRRSNQQPQGHLVRWERFLPFRSLRVLLVENDDSTRDIVSALLRNCGYEVKDVPNGKQAWKVLEDITTDVDLVLTEVATPCLSGIGLLCKIMSNKTFKDIPVIMMSSHDSRSMVLKCLSKGAVDFLVKPIRKNELKNLWQHVWRKYHISSGSGSESGIWIEKPIKSRTVEDSDNNNGSNDEDDTESIGLDFRGESDSGTQAIHPREEPFVNNWLPESATRTPVGQDDELDKKIMGKDLKICICSIPSMQAEDPCEKGLSNKPEKSIELNTMKNDEQLEKGELDLNNEDPNAEKNQAVHLMGASTNGIDPHIESVVLDISNGLYNGTFMKDKAIHDNKERPFFEVILKRPRDVQDTENRAHDRNVMRHSDLSAFSRYNSASTANQAPTGNVGSCSPLDNSSDAAKTESAPNIQSDSNGAPPNQSSNGSSNNNDMGSTTNDVFTKQVSFADKPTPKSSIKYQTSSSSLQQAHNGQAFQPTIQGASQYDSSDVLKAPVEGIVSNHNLNRSASGSSRWSNGHKKTSTASNSRRKKMGSGKRIPEKRGTNEETGYENISGEDENRFAQREAALRRFRQKRQERCFEKKVRYQSRKKLAEQRPRVRGQFIRKGMQDNKGKGISYEPDSIPQ
ncbi:two-component response regulator-like PRR37 isoform X2 [Morus notabilis]|uniref:two-component response regulator-like PRR37 isoform X2 n=1 Tax=Morus notabilis TaxID=981085 RepID=UPI000CED22B0|nr:two-component response regulator-like PRR37 isoform X2 [Morus notabilis]